MTKNIRQQKVLSEFLTNRGSLIELIIVAIILGLGIEFLASSIYSKIEVNHKNLYFFVAGLVFCLTSIAYFFVKFFGVKKMKKTIDGFIIINQETNELVEIDNYDYLRTIASNLDAAKSEDEAIKIDWESTKFQFDPSKTDFLNGKKLINELTEYYILETMSTHLTDFFNSNETNKEQLVELNRNDIPAVLLSNRFLELFSKPMEQRAAFKKDEKKEAKGNKLVGKIVASYTKGALFQHFDFVLPKKSIITKDKSGYIIIKTNRLTLKFKSKFEGFGAVLPRGYAKYFLKIPDYGKYRTLKVSVKLEFELNFGALLLRNGWNYYNWVDSLLEKIDHKISEDLYFDKIDWDKAYAILKSQKD